MATLELICLLGATIGAGFLGGLLIYWAISR
jgi:nitrogen fixation-related uncharacterized protein